MACTLSNRETFVVMSWLENDPERRARLRANAEKLRPGGIEHAIPRMSKIIADELDLELPELEGVAREMLRSGLMRVNFIELAVAVLTDAEVEFAGKPITFA